ncbi:MAG: SLC13 family permease [Bacillota bacterium]
MVVLALIASGRFRIDLVALGGLLILGLAGAAQPQVIFSGFGHPALATIVAVFLVSQGIVESGLLRGLGQAVARRLDTLHGQTLSIAAVGSVLSAFMNNVGAVGLMLPITVRMARRFGTDPGNFGLPLAIASILGGTVTLVGSAPNIIIASYMFSATGQSFKMFDYAPHGLAMLSLAFILLLFCNSCGINPVGNSSRFKDDDFLSKRLPGEYCEPTPVCQLPGNDKSESGETKDNGINKSDNGEPENLNEKFSFAPLSNRQKQITLVILLVAVISVSFGFLHPAFGFGFAALLMIAGGVLKISSAYKNIDLKIVIFLGSMLGIGQTLEQTGAIDPLSSILTGFTKGFPTFWIIVMLIVVSSLLSNAINNSAAAVFMAPLAIGIATGSNLETAAALMATAAGANLTLLIPTHQAALMVMSKAPFPFASFMRFGLVLSVLCVFAASAVITVIWQ